LVQKMARAKQRVRRREDRVVGCGWLVAEDVKHGFADAWTSLASTYALTLEQADADIHASSPAADDAAP
jgi:hypothetical protein